MTKHEFEAALDELRKRLLELRAQTEQTMHEYDVTMLRHWCENEAITHEIQALRAALGSGRQP
jgi:hypothetical protein